MKTFDIQYNINQDTYMDEFQLKIHENKSVTNISLTVDELLNLYYEIKHAVETTIY